MERRIVLFEDMLTIDAPQMIFCGYIEGANWTFKTKQLSRAHRQFNRIYSGKGIHPALASSETEGRYYVCVED